MIGRGLRHLAKANVMTLENITPNETKMKRRTFLATMNGLAALEALPVLAAAGDPRGRSTSDRLPRKVIVGTAMRSFWGQYPRLHSRLDQLTGMVDQMAVQMTPPQSILVHELDLPNP